MATAVRVGENFEIACDSIAKELLRNPQLTRSEATRLIKEITQRFSLEIMPRNSDVLRALSPEGRKALAPVLLVKPVRTASGIAVIGVVTKPFACPHGTCVFCPGGVPFGTPQSYTGTEPATMRAIENEYDPYRQITSRLLQLSNSGHSISKVELVILGGTFLSLPLEYQEEFVRACFEAVVGKTCSSLEEAQKLAEVSQVRNVGLTIETKPDFCKQEHVDLMLRYGATRVEIGVQALDDRIYELVNRGHTLDDVSEAFQIARDAGFKIVAHMMPGLPGSNPEKDLDDFRRLFEDPSFRPDMLKIYPTLVVEHTGLYGWYRLGRYKPYELATVVNLLAEMKKLVPRWVRIMRINREFASSDIVAGVKNSNLRELVLREVSRRGYSCKCIRCREVGLKIVKDGIEVNPDNVKLRLAVYEASGGTEIFASYEEAEHDALIGFIRVRLPSNRAHRPEIRARRACLVRELHVYGLSTPLRERYSNSWQHRGYGSMLMAEAERIAKEEFDAKKVLIISAMGTREYYRRLGYSLEGAYMAKRL